MASSEAAAQPAGHLAPLGAFLGVLSHGIFNALRRRPAAFQVRRCSCLPNLRLAFPRRIHYRRLHPGCVAFPLLPTRARALSFLSLRPPQPWRGAALALAGGMAGAWLARLYADTAAELNVQYSGTARLPSWAQAELAPGALLVERRRENAAELRKKWTALEALEEAEYLAAKKAAGESPAAVSFARRTEEIA